MCITAQRKDSSAHLRSMILVMFWKVSLYHSNFCVFPHAKISAQALTSVPKPLMMEICYLSLWIGVLVWLKSSASLIPLKYEEIIFTVRLLVHVNIWERIYSWLTSCLCQVPYALETLFCIATDNYTVPWKEHMHRSTFQFTSKSLKYSQLPN